MSDLDLYVLSAALSANSAAQSAALIANSVVATEQYRTEALEAAANSYVWAEGSEPGGPGTKSAKGWAEDAAESAAFAEEFSGPAYDTVSAGETATTAGQFFRVSNGDTPRTYTRYQRTAGGSVEAAPLTTTVDLASTGGAGLVGTETGASVQEAIKYFKSNGTDDSDALIAYLDLIASRGGGTVLLPPLIFISKQIKVPDGVNLWGGGSTRNNDEGSVIRCIGASAQIAFGGVYTTASDPSLGGESGNFTIDANNVATTPFYIGRSLKRVWTAIQVLNAVGSSITIREAQNCIFNSVNSDGGDVGLDFDRGCGGLLFNQCNWNDAATVGIKGRETWGLGTSFGVYANPQQNVFMKCISERSGSGTAIDMIGCQDMLFIHCDIAGTVSSGSGELVLMKFDACARIEFLKCNFVGTLNRSIALDLYNASQVTFIGSPRFNSFQNLFRSVNSRINIDNYGASGITGTEDFNATTTNNVRRLFRRPMEIAVPGSTSPLWLGSQQGDTGFRIAAYADGSLRWTNGTSFTSDTSIYRGAAGVVTTGGSLQGMQGVGTGLLTAEPTSKRAGYLVFADGVAWNPLAITGGRPYPVWWTGSAWSDLNAVNTTFATRAVASASVIGSLYGFVRTSGYTSVGDHGGALYKRAISEPTHPGKFQSADGAWWELVETNVRPEMFGAKGDCVYNFISNTATGTDDSAAVQAAFDYFQLRGVSGTVIFRALYRINSVQAMGASLNAGLQIYGNGIRLEREGAGYIGCAFTASSATVNYRGLHVNGGGKVSNDASTNRVVDATGYGITATINEGVSSVVLTTGAGANFAAGDIVFLRTGQLNNPPIGEITEPDSELNEVQSVSGDTITLRYPTLTTYQQEYYKSGTTGVTTPTVTANPAPFTLANVTDRVMRGFYCDIDLIGHNCEQVLNLWGLLDAEVSTLCRIWHGKNGTGSRESDRVIYSARHYHTGRALGYFSGPSTGCTRWTMQLWGVSPLSYAYFHFHEGLKNITVLSLWGQCSGNASAANAGVSILARAYKYRFDSVYFDTGTANQPAITISQSSSSDGQFCDGGVSFGSVRHRCNNATGSAILINAANVSFDSDPVALGSNDRLSNVTYLRTTTYGHRIGNHLLGAFVYNKQLILGSIGQDSEIIEIRSRIDQAFATGDRRFRMGFTGTMNAYINDQVVNTLTAGQVTETRRGVTLVNGTAGTSYAGASIASPQSASRTIIAEINAGSGTTDFTAGLMRVSAVIGRTARTS